LDVYGEVVLAERRIRPYIRETPLDYSLHLSDTTAAEVFLKLENLQYTGSFKLRGAMNKLLSLTPQQQARGVVTASSGNHGAGVAFGLHTLQISGLVFVPEDASTSKVAMIRRYGVEVRTYGADSVITEAYARSYAEHNDLIYISPYNDPAIIGGQGTIAAEIDRQLTSVDAVFVAVGGGGLISGIAGYLKDRHSAITVIGCSPERAPPMVESVKAGRIVELPTQPTLSDGTAGGIEPGAITFDLCRKLVDSFVLVSEDEIAAAMRLLMETQHVLVEGAAGVALAGYLKLHEHFRGRRVVIVLCGANISLATLKTIL
jgi:threonine dehydratase